MKIDFGSDYETIIFVLKERSDYIKNKFPNDLDKLTSGDLFNYIAVDLIWDDDKEQTHYFNITSIFYLILLIDLVNALFYFLLDDSKNKKEKNYFYKSYFDYQAYFLLVNNIETDGYIYMIIHGIPLPTNANGEMGSNPDAPYIGHQELLDFMFNVQKSYDQEIIQRPELGKKGFKQYLRHTPEELVKKVLPCFIENIYDLPEGSVFWETAVIKEVMIHYEALKKYAEEKL